MKNSIVSLGYKRGKVIVNLKIKGIAENTGDLPNTLPILKNNLPTIFENKCFNGKGLSFYDEVQHTETAHLLEHIILELMCLSKTKYDKCAEYEGRTYWDIDNVDSTYQIRIRCPLVDWPLFQLALTNGLNLVDRIAQKPNNFLELPKS